MKKIPTLFVRNFYAKGKFTLTDTITPGFEWVLNGEGEATVKIDGSATAIINGEFYKRYDAKAGQTVPFGAIPCSDPDPITGHWPHWVKVEPCDPSNKWFIAAYEFAKAEAAFSLMALADGTYEAIGLHFNGNPYNLDYDTLQRHGIKKVAVERSFEGIKKFLTDHYIEGLVFWKDGEPKSKIKRSDFGLTWNKK